MSDATGNPPPGSGDRSDNPYGQQPPPYGGRYGQDPDSQQGAPDTQGPQGPQGPVYPQQEYGQQYGQQYGQYGGYGQPAQPSGKRPGTVTAAGVITLVFSGLSLALFGFVALILALAGDGVVEEVRRQLGNEPGLADIDPTEVVSVIIVVCVVFAVWCLAALVLAVFAMRRSNGARIGLVVSSAVVAALSLLGITSGVSVVTLAAAIAVIVCLFAGGASDWYRGQAAGAPAPPRQSGPIA